MIGLGSKLVQLDELKQHWADLLAASGTGHGPGEAGDGRLTEVTSFGPNPGALRMLCYVPERLAPRPGLVVVLHGCTQTASGYDEGAGWSTLAERHGFVVLFPEQSRTNNPKLCFNWYGPDDTSRDSGEVLSIRNMVEHAIGQHRIDRSRVFVTGLSAGGAMAGAMLATYPELFSAGAIVAGLPYGGARNVQEALDLMFHGRSHPATDWGDRVRSASGHRGPWPRVSVWHGSQDATVKPVNAGETVKQWLDVHGLATMPGTRETVNGHLREAWRDRSGREVVESITITGMAHGTPLDCGPGDTQCGRAGPFMLQAGISSSWHIARFFGLTDRKAAPKRAARAAASDAPKTGLPGAARPLDGDVLPPLAQDGGGAGGAGIDVLGVIQKALRSAGLMR